MLAASSPSSVPTSAHALNSLHQAALTAILSKKAKTAAAVGTQAALALLPPKKY